MTPSELIRNYKATHPRGHFFDTETLSFFGERVSNMRVNDVKVVNSEGQLMRAYKLTSLQRNAPIKPFYSVHYFDQSTFDEVSVMCEV